LRCWFGVYHHGWTRNRDERTSRHLCGQTHYRGRGITIDPNTWDEYYATLEKVLGDIPAHQMNEKQIEFAWNYAYRFFFEYPRPFPWRLMNFWDDLEVWPLEKVLSEEGMAQFKDTFGFLGGRAVYLEKLISFSALFLLDKKKEERRKQ
jgi:hypothetical protein